MTNRIEKLPVLILNPHNRCNCRCVMCEIWKRKEVQEFGLAELRGQMESIEHLGVEWVVLTGGEPLLSAELFAMCAELRVRRIRITLLSSGLLLERYAADIVRHVDDVIVSLDGPPAIHNRIRNISRAFELLESGVRRIRDLDRGFPVAARCTVQRENCRHLQETVLAARALELHSVSFLAADTHSNAFDHQLPMAADGISPRAGDIEALESEIERLIESGDCGTFVLESPEKLRRIARHFRGEWTAPICNAPWHSAVIEANGTVRPCFFHQPVGSVSDGAGLAEVLNSRAAIHFRENLNVETNPICRRCVCSLNWKAS